jgi:hypothetical protein
VRKIRRYNFRVVVNPEEPRGTRWFLGCGPLTPQEQLDAEDESNARELEAEIKRHIPDIASVRIESDVEYLCSFCGARWTEGDAADNGGCCDQDWAVHLEHHPEDRDD